MDLIKNSTNIETDKVFDNGKKWEANVREQYKTMGKKSEIQELKDLAIEGFNNVNSRLDNVEKKTWCCGKRCKRS